MKRRIGIMCLALTMSITMFCGCEGIVEQETAEDVKQVEPLTFEEVALQENQVASEEAAVYKYLTSTLNLQIENLLSIDAKAKEDITQVISETNEYLRTGESLTLDLQDEIANYMLMEFAKTPYEWQFEQMQILGVDAPTSLYFVDVTYKTTNKEKYVMPSTILTKGSEGYEGLVKQRYEDYILYLEQMVEEGGGEVAVQLSPTTEKQLSESNEGVTPEENTESNAEGNTVGNTEDNAEIGVQIKDNLQANVVAKPQAEFEAKWGDIDVLLETQDTVTLLNRLRQKPEKSEGIGQYTYEGFASTEVNNTATMTFRFVLNYEYLWGVADKMAVKAVYLKDYQLDNTDTLIANKTNDKRLAVAEYEDFIVDKIQAFKKAEESTNHKGLYNIMSNYGEFEIYYDDIKKYAYSHFKGFTQEILGVEDNKIFVLLTTQNQIRAKGTEMSLPTYEEKYILELSVGKEDEITINNYTMLSSTLIGEPLSVIRNVSGTSEQLLYTEGAFSKSNEEKVYETLNNFVQFQLIGDIQSTESYNVMDMGVSSTAKQNIQSNIESIQSLGTQKSLMLIQNWETKSNTYVLLHIRELFLGEESGQDCESTIALANRNGEWKVISYVRNKINSYTANASDFPAEYTENADYFAYIEGDKAVVEQRIVVGSNATSDTVNNYDKENYGVEDGVTETVTVE